MKLWLRNQILKQRGKLTLLKCNNSKVKNSILEGFVLLGRDVTVKNSILKGNIHLLSSVENCQIKGNVTIGKYCAIADDVTFQGIYHTMKKPCMQMKFYKEITGEDMPLESKGTIFVANDVWIGTKAIILSGVKVGNGAVIGAGSVVTKDVQHYEIVAGNPAKHIKFRFPVDIANMLEEKKWWSWSKNKMKENNEWFKENLM